MNVSTDLEMVPFLLDELGLEAPLKQMPRAFVTEIEIGHVAAVEKLHPRRQVGFGRFDEEVIVIRH